MKAAARSSAATPVLTMMMRAPSRHEHVATDDAARVLHLVDRAALAHHEQTATARCGPDRRERTPCARSISPTATPDGVLVEKTYSREDAKAWTQPLLLDHVWSECLRCVLALCAYCRQRGDAAVWTV